MSKNVYIAAAEPRSGKSVVALGVMELASRLVDRVTFFRPVIRDAKVPDPEFELMLGLFG